MKVLALLHSPFREKARQLNIKPGNEALSQEESLGMRPCPIPGGKPGNEALSQEESLGMRPCPRRKAWERGLVPGGKPGNEALSQEESLGTRPCPRRKAWERGLVPSQEESLGMEAIGLHSPSSSGSKVQVPHPSCRASGQGCYTVPALREDAWSD